MPYRINGVDIVQPSESHWLNRDELGRTGLGQTVYPATRQLELKWDFLSMAEFYGILGYYNQQGASGSVIMDLPTWGGSMWAFKSYTGTILDEPKYDIFFEQYYQGVSLLVANIRT